MEQFVGVAIAHFLALLIPGVDFFLIARTAMTGGWRNATGACLGIAAANAMIIAAAFSGVSLISHPVVLDAIQLAGAGFLIFVGVAFLRSGARIDPDQVRGAERTTWLRNFGLGIASGLLNPKNALFYLSLAAVVGAAAPLTLVGYGAWMVGILLAWDIFVAVLLGSRRALAGMDRVLPWLTRLAGGFLVLFGATMIITLAVRVLGPGAGS
ncbi:LysE family translocator [Naumannella cuiyingiana]|uniref:Threonine/homoserine/homoserine lactone efflux protein n=1 Tax=Naumannella cuiyingiana TaxID=1347891 RepID=A0A7Z0IK63_9ACTN|nr:LysE family translocator [Naumannella cuiyingiana]NYI70132.1 threonine/homoserine/homoserine lactone efflux protein [Naumannella cuiyingiana]